MDESDSAAFAVTVGPNRAEYARQVRATARETLARSRGNDQFRDADQPLGVPEPRPRDRRAPLASRGRTPPAPAPTAEQPDTSSPTWAEERAAVLDAIVALRTLCETLHDRLAELRHEQTGEFGMLGAWRELNQWGDEECTRIEAAGHSRDDEGKEEPFEIPPLRALRQNTDA